MSGTAFSCPTNPKDAFKQTTLKSHRLYKQVARSQPPESILFPFMTINQPLMIIIGSVAKFFSLSDNLQILVIGRIDD